MLRNIRTILSKYHNTHNTFYLVLIVLIFSACSPTKHLSKNGYLLSKNTITINNKTISKGNLVNYIQQDPNHKFLGIKAGMYIYSLSRPGDDSVCNFFERNILRSVGDKPVEIDNDLIDVSCQNIKTYLKTHGCFDAKITTEQKKVHKPYAPWSYYKRRRIVEYNINAPIRAVIDTFILQTEDKALYPVISEIIQDNPIKKGVWYDEDQMVSLRSTVASKMEEKGYYAFSSKYISFTVDTTEGVDKTKIVMFVANPSSSSNDTMQNNRHKPYKVSKIYLYPNYISPNSSDYLPPLDTVLYYHKQQKGYALTPLYFINNTKKPFIKERAIMRCILMQNNNLYSPEASANTYSSLYQLKNYKYIDISYEDITNGVKDTNDLACYIRLTRNKPISLSSSFELNYSASNAPTPTSNSSSNFGMQGALSYSDKNLLRGAEIFTADLILATEINSGIFSEYNTNTGWDIFNAFEAGINFGIELPRFLAPFSTSFYSMKFHPHTSIKTGYNIQKRNYYERSIFSLNYGYSWNTSQKSYHTFIPIEVNYVNMNITSSNYDSIIRTMDRRIQYQMSDHLVMAIRYSYNYNGQSLQQKDDFNYFSFNIETAGNVLDAISILANSPKDDEGHYTFIDIPFAQYVRADFALTHYKYISKKSTFVYKIFAGLGVPYGNAESLPYEKAFFGGGANNIRAWQLRSLGPGSSKKGSVNRYDRAGDITLGANFEYRYPMFDPIEGAAFVDLGNIWTINEQKGLEGGKFSEDFYKEIACGVGLGLRLNLSVFIVRLDFAVKVWDPSKEMKNCFVLNKTNFSDISLQFGIGYPF